MLSKEEIKEILVRNIYEATKEHFESGDEADKTRMIMAKWYLTCSTSSYKGLLKGIEEIISKSQYTKQLYTQEEAEELVMFVKNLKYMNGTKMQSEFTAKEIVELYSNKK